MEQKKRTDNNYAFIDGQNLYLAVKQLGWKLDYKRFRVYLADKYQIKKAYIFMGFMPTNQDLYNFLQTVGFVLIFKPLLHDGRGVVKGNCDAEFVLQTMIDYADYEKALLVTGDGDFYCLARHLENNNKLLRVLAPTLDNCSELLTKAAGKNVAFVSDLKQKLEYKRKEPHKDETL